MADKPKIMIEKSMDLHPQCNFCLTKDNVNTIYTDRLALVISMCDSCLAKIYESRPQ